jgi:hypothetical protein
VLIHFLGGAIREAYEVIASVEPDKLYRWREYNACKDGETADANVLFGRKPLRDSHPMEDSEWDGKKEPLFTVALEVVRETLEQNREFTWDLKPLFRLEMAYTLLWSAIERFAAFKYHMGENVMRKVTQLADEPSFASGLRELVTQPREIFRTDNPERKLRLDPGNPSESIQYYYQIRSNIVHRGKATCRDHDILAQALGELLPLFERVLDSEFSASAH